MSEVANTIMSQLGGGRRLAVMTGAKNFLSHSDGYGALSFRVGKNAKKINYVKVTLTSADLYDVEFGWIYGMKYTVRATENGIYNDMLMDSFERNTGMYLTLAPRG